MASGADGTPQPQQALLFFLGGKILFVLSELRIGEGEIAEAVDPYLGDTLCGKHEGLVEYERNYGHFLNEELFRILEILASCLVVCGSVCRVDKCVVLSVRPACDIGAKGGICVVEYSAAAVHIGGECCKSYEGIGGVHLPIDGDNVKLHVTLGGFLNKILDLGIEHLDGGAICKVDDLALYCADRLYGHVKANALPSCLNDLGDGDALCIVVYGKGKGLGDAGEVDAYASAE